MPRRDGLMARFIEALSSLRLTLVCLALFMILVVACTLAQVPLGTHLAVERYIRSVIVWWSPEDSALRIPIFPGGGLVGGLLLVNLGLAQFRRLEWSRRKAGLWVVHIGLALLFIGEFAASMFQVDARMPIEVGQTRDWTEDYRQMELAVIDGTDPAFDDVRAIPESLLKTRGEIAHDSLPFKLALHGWYDNALLAMRAADDPPSLATAGIGANLTLRPMPPASAEGEQNSSVVLVEPVAKDGTRYGTFLVSNALGAPQGFAHEGRNWRLVLRNRRYQLPFSLTLKEFRHDVYPGTDIPKNFSSLLRLKDSARGEERDVLVYMNAPLRHDGLTFYQASFGKNDTLSILQVVRNPGWTIPYLSCALVALGLLWHFALSLKQMSRRFE